MTVKANISDRYDSIEVFDSSIFVEVIVKGKKEKKARNAINTVKNGDTRLPATTHEVLGEVTDVLMDEEVFQDENSRIEARKEFSKLRNGFTLLTPEPNSLKSSLRQVLSEDDRLEPTDALILAKSYAFNAKKIFCRDEAWSLDSIKIKNI